MHLAALQEGLVLMEDLVTLVAVRVLVERVLEVMGFLEAGAVVVAEAVMVVKG